MLTFQVKKVKWIFPGCLCFENTRNKLEVKSRPRIRSLLFDMLTDRLTKMNWLTDWLIDIDLLKSAPQIDWSGAFQKWTRNTFIAKTLLLSPSTGQLNDTCIIGLMGYWLRGHKGESNNCFSKIQLVSQEYRDKTTSASKTRLSRYCFGFQSRHFLLLVGSSNSQAVRGRYVYRSFFFSDHCIKQIDVVARLFSNRSQRTSQCGKNISDTLAGSSCAISLFSPHFDVICDLLPNRRTATWNLFVK